MKIVCDSHIPFINGVLEPYADVVYLPGQDISADAVRDADAMVIRTRTRCDKSLLSGSKVRFIATATIGYDHIDTEWCRDNGITWTNAPGCNSWSVQQYMGSLLVNLSRSMGFSCRDKTIGIVGVGNVGSKVARIAALLGFRVLLCDPPRAEKEKMGGFVTISDIVTQSDIISLHVPLTLDGPDSTFHLFDRDRLGTLNANQILVNTSRGEVVDCLALKDMLRDNRFKAALDVWENEPRIDTELAGLLYTGTPHIAGYSIDGKATGTMMSVQSLGRFFDLPCKDWEVDEVPQCDRPTRFTLDTAGKKPQEVLADAILRTYDVLEDSSRLMSHISSFEGQRSHYPVRREFPAFTVRLLNDDTGRATVFLREAGFNIFEE